MYAKILLISAAILVFVILAVALLVFFFLHRSPGVPALPSERAKLALGGVTLDIAVARTLPEKVRGLSGQLSLPPNEGLLFVWSHPAPRSFWMKDMRFPIDIVWFGADWRVVDITADATPESFPRTFSPQEPAQYVLEVPAGFAAAHSVKIGDTASLR